MDSDPTGLKDSNHKGKESDMDDYNALEGRRNEMLDIIGQNRNVEVAFAAGALPYEDYIAGKGLLVAATRALAKLEAGEDVTDEQFAEMVAGARAEAELPSETEALRADVDFLLMTGGVE